MRKKETRKVVQIGSSFGIELPQSIIDSLKIKRGDEIEFDVRNNQIVLSRKRKWEDEVDAEMLDMLSETLKEHDQVFKNLKNR
ncbi:hypothetical protein GCM10010954_22190 [Halobacillus andaensis]|uniref:SpoVT-AbrB domain-containing protein n=1 Tax=Halobacillus andaensis TaxID=1176239 RepID=A0A917B5B0_HALAA|nr:AbrB/MazE/SpoVT family DNA-binding domain-containing protein [Halobacillus andaensis]MBP2004273.1 putative addiction module antidote [Halobacillus andaensis]GGF22944.1 hypothetical protein GCM10010954_22190 [Halobacillus andaensis]